MARPLQAWLLALHCRVRPGHRSAICPLPAVNPWVVPQPDPCSCAAVPTRPSNAWYRAAKKPRQVRAAA